MKKKNHSDDYFILLADFKPDNHNGSKKEKEQPS